MSKLTASGLRLKPSYEELMNMIVSDNIIKPKKKINLLDNQALIDSFEFSELRKMALVDLERLDEGVRKQQLMNEEFRKIAKENGTSTQAVKQEMKQPNVKTMYYDMADDNSEAYDDAMDEAMEIEKEEEEKKKQKVKKSVEKVKQSLYEGEPKTMAQKIAMKKYKQAPIGAAALPADMYEPEDIIGWADESADIKRARLKNRTENYAATMIQKLIRGRKVRESKIANGADSSVQVPMNVENEEPPKTRLERKQEKKIIKQMFKEPPPDETQAQIVPAEAIKPKRKKEC